MSYSPNTLEEFMLPPTQKQWDAEIALGWPAPDGSTMSTDKIMGVRIGKTSAEFKYASLPANKHDWRYRLARRLTLSEVWRMAADIGYRDDCIHFCKVELKGWKLKFAIFRCHVRYVTLRTSARFAWTQEAKMQQDKWRNANHDLEKA